MERLMQYLDDIEDVFYAIALLKERVRRLIRTVIVLTASVVVQILGILLALSRPPMALAVVCLMAVAIMYRAVTGPHPARAQPN